MDRFDVCRAYYWALSVCHEGHGSAKYARLSKLGGIYRPSPLDSESRIEAEDSDAGQLYRDLVARWTAKAQ
jgi:hypothetical protein